MVVVEGKNGQEHGVGWGDVSYFAGCELKLFGRTYGGVVDSWL